MLFFVTAFACVCEAQTVDEGLSAADPVPVYLSDNEQKDFTSRREELEGWRLDLETRIQSHNDSCRRVDITDQVLMGDCQESKSRLEEEIHKYQEAVRYYSDILTPLRRYAKEDIPVKQLPEESVKYFMLGNYFDFIDFPGEDKPKRAWPGPKNPDKRTVYIDDPLVEENDKNLLKPLDYFAVDLISLDEATQIVIARQEAREREAMRISSKMLIKERGRLMREGVIKSGENILMKEKKDPEFYRLMKEIYQTAAEKEIEQIHRAAQLAIDELAEIISRKEKKNNPELMRAELAARNDARDSYYAKMLEISQSYSRNLSSEIQGLKEKGYHKEGEDLLQKDSSSLRFRQAVRTIAIKVFTQKRNEENSAFARAVSGLKESCYLEKNSNYGQGNN